MRLLPRRLPGCALLGLAALALALAQPEATEAQSRTAEASGWVDLDWAYRIPITVPPDSVQGSGSLSEFPVLLTLGPAQGSVFDGARADGKDLLVTAGDGLTVLNHEVVKYDPIGHYAEIWFKAAPLSKTANAFYLYYGNPTFSTGPAPGGAWNSKYVAVYHFSENPALGQLKDWSPRASHAVSSMSAAMWTAGDVTAGQIGQAWLFNGTTHHVSGNAISTPDTSFVISAWLQVPSRSTDFTFQANPQYWHVSAQINEVHRAPHYSADNPARDLRWGPNPLPDDDQFHYFTWVFDGQADTIFFYFDGIEQEADPHAIDPSLEHFYTGHPINPDHLPVGGCGVAGPMFWNTFDLMDGPADEFRVSERTHSGDWVRTEYRNQRDPQGFFMFGDEEAGGTVPVRLLSFTASRDQDGALIEWKVAAEDDRTGFHVHRETVTGERERLTTELVWGGSSFSYRDPAPPLGPTLYWLREHARSGELTWHGPVLLAPKAASAASVARLAAAPNPFRAGTTIRFTLQTEEVVELTVYDLRGREVSRLVSGPLPAGAHTIEWNGLDLTGARAVAGIYLARLTAGPESTSGKLVLLP